MKKLLILLVCVIVLSVGVSAKYTCGDNVCETGESTGNCPQDCGYYDPSNPPQSPYSSPTSPSYPSYTTNYQSSGGYPSSSYGGYPSSSGGGSPGSTSIYSVGDYCLGIEEAKGMVDECSKMGGTGSTSMIGNNCYEVRCDYEQKCISIEEQASQCKRNGGYVETGTDWSNNCEYIRCRYGTQPNRCPTITEQKERCLKMAGILLDGTDRLSDGCEYIRCKKQDIACPTDVDPVCGTDQKIYSNACNAGRAGVGVAYKGDCKEIICTTDVDPVCGTDQKTYSNDCNARRAGVGVAYKGDCKKSICRSESDLEEEKQRCEKEKGVFSRWQGNDGCPQISCQRPMECEWVKREKELCLLNGGNPRQYKKDILTTPGAPRDCPSIICDYSKVVAFPTREECENKLNCFCDYKDCRYIPQGMTYYDACGKNFKKGWYCSKPKDKDDSLKCGGVYGGGCPTGYRCETPSGSWDAIGKCIKDEQQYSCYEWREEEISRERERCRKVNGDFKKVKDDYSSSGCYSYRCFSKEKCGMGVECIDGYYCEYPDMRMSVSHEQRSNEQYGRCIIISERAGCLSDEQVKEETIKCGESRGEPRIDAENGCVKSLSCMPRPEPPQPPEERPPIPPEERPPMPPTEPRLPFPPEEGEQDLGKLFNVIFKLEEVRVQFDVLKKKTLSIADYYEKQGDKDYARKFIEVSKLFDGAIKELDEVKSDLRTQIENDEVNEETFEQVRAVLGNIKDSMKNILKALLR